MKTTLQFILIGMLLALSSCFSSAKDNYVSKQITPSAFKSLNIHSNFNVTFEQSDTYSVELEIPEKAMKNLIVKMEGSTLELGFHNTEDLPKKYLSINKPLAKIKAPTFESIKLSGASDLTFLGDIKIKGGKIIMNGASDIQGGNIHVAQDMKLYLSGASACELDLTAASTYIEAAGASDVELNLSCLELEVNCGGASEVKLNGINNQAGSKLNAELSGSSELDTSKSPYERVVIKASGSSEAKVYPTKSIKANASGASTIRYKEEPSLLDIDVSASTSSSIKTF